MDNEKEKIVKKRPPFILSMRFLLAILVFFGYALQYAQKIDMSVSIVCMVNNTALLLQKAEAASANNLTFHDATGQNRTSVDQCPNQETSQKSFNGEFVWGKDIQGNILASYFYGYTLSNLPGGYLSMKFGGKYVNFFAILIGSAATLFTPLCARLHYGYLFAARALTGFAHGVMWPAVASMWAHWAVPEERSRLISFGSAGSQIGNVIALPLGSFLCQWGFAGGWPSIFYVFGIAGILWCVAWFILTADSPDSHRFIREREKEYVLSGTNVMKHQHTPWKSIMTSRACIALFIGHVCSNWGIYLFLTNIPTYMKEVLKFDIKSNGGLSALPYIAFWVVIIVTGIISDKLLQVKKGANLSKIDEKKLIEKRRRYVRILFNALGYLMPMCAVIGLSFVKCQYPYLGVGLLVFGLAFCGCQYGGGFLVNYNDVCGRYSGMVLGIGNTFASIPGFLAPFFVGKVTKNQLQEEWRWVFLTTAGVYLIGALVLCIFGKAKPEPWTVLQTQQAETAEPEESVPLREEMKEEKNINS